MGDISEMDLVYKVLLLVLVVGGFVASFGRRTRFAVHIRHAAIWIGIFVLLLAAYSLRDDLSSLGMRMRSELLPAEGVATGPSTAAFRAARDGHFHVEAEVDGAKLRLLVDTGATKVGLSRRDAERIGLDLAKLAYTERVMTANGPARAAPVVLREVRVGPIVVRNVPASVSERRDDVSLLGLSFLNRLESYTASGGTLTLVGRN